MEASNVEKNTARSLVPLLSFSYRRDKRMNTICTVSESICQNPPFIPELCGKKCLASYFEWLVLMDKKTYELCLFNMNSMEKIKLPDMDVRRLYRCDVSCEGDDPRCRIAFIVWMGQQCVIMLCKPGDKKYAIHYWKDDNKIFWPATIFKGNLYCLLSHSYNMVCGNISGPTTTTNIEFEKVIKEGIPRPSHEEIFSSVDYLFSADNELMLVQKIDLGWYEEILNFRVYRADFINKVWVEIESIGDQTIFLDKRQAVCCLAAEAGTRKNCIYFAEPRDRKLYIFDLKDQSFSTSLPCPHISRNLVKSAWIMKRI